MRDHSPLPGASGSRFPRRSFLSGAAGAALAGVMGARPLWPRSATRPNIVMMVADDMGYGDLSSYGCPDTRTPHIDSIGARGVRFTRFYANAPECTPTRSALLTGRYQQRVGGMECAIGVGNVGRYDEAIWLQQRGELGLPASEVTLPRIFKENGYDTACFGKWHLGYLEKFRPLAHGFDEYFGVLGGNANYFTHRELGGEHHLYHNDRRVEREGYLTDLFVEHSVDWLRRRSGAPFFLYVPFTAPHTPVQGPDDRDKKIDDSNFNEGDRPTYVRMVERMDDGVGEILARLKAMGASDNTLVIFFSDNGGYNLSLNGPFRGAKSNVYEGGIRVPMLMSWPGMLPEGKTTDLLGITMDLLPTLIEAAGLRPPRRRFDGVNLLPAILGRRPLASRPLFWRYKRGQAVRKAVLDGDLKYIWDNGREELYNLANDLGERNDILAGSPEAARRLRARLARWEREVRAPRLRDFRPPPA